MDEDRPPGWISGFFDSQYPAIRGVHGALHVASAKADIAGDTGADWNLSGPDRDGETIYVTAGEPPPPVCPSSQQGARRRGTGRRR